MKSDWRDKLEKKLMAAPRIAILGVGNSLRGDDAAGGIVVRELKNTVGKRKGRKTLLLDGGEAPESLTGEVRKFDPSHVLIVDAARGGHKPGTIYLVDRDEISQDDLTTHRIPLIFLIGFLEDSLGCRVEVIGIEPKNLDLGEPVSEEVFAAISLLAEELEKILMA
ncbi:MAG: hydrogenase maturation peptidase HycI [Candidatus Aminicenantes bacterium RBG_13_59_9]|nr:MAG: hydrogenase maturation peptidase HycI [Candidatus Aminicenantes bacterium RBG_13_59_9]